MILISYLFTAKEFLDDDLLNLQAAPGAEDQGGGEVPDPGAILDQETKVVTVTAAVSTPDEAPVQRTAPGRGTAPDPRIRTRPTSTALVPVNFTRHAVEDSSDSSEDEDKLDGTDKSRSRDKKIKEVDIADLLSTFE